MSSIYTSGIIIVNLEKLAEDIQSLIKEPASGFNLTFSDLCILTPEDGSEDIHALLAAGTKPMDALVYCKCTSARKGEAKIQVSSTKASNENLVKAKRVLLSLYLFTLLRASHPKKDDESESTDPPAFLKRYPEGGRTEREIAENSASFSLTLLSPAWVKYIDTSGFSQTILSRISLGLPGYRLINAISLLRLKSDSPAEIVSTHDWIIRNLSKGYYWDIYPATRTADVSSKLKSINRALSDFMAVAYPQTELVKLVEMKVLYALPKPDPRHSYWRTWHMMADLDLKEPMFKAAGIKPSTLASRDPDPYRRE